MIFEFIKVIINYLLNNNASKKKVSKMKKQPIPEDFELSDDEPTTVNFNKEQKLTSKFITFDCPLCCGNCS